MWWLLLRLAGENQYCWSVAISLADSKTLLLSTSKSAYGAHYKESANSILYRRTGSDAWKQVRKGLPDPQGLRIPVVAASSSEPGVFYCSTEGMVYRSEDDGLQWQKLAVQWNSKATAEHATGWQLSKRVSCPQISGLRSPLGGTSCAMEAVPIFWIVVKEQG